MSYIHLPGIDDSYGFQSNTKIRMVLSVALVDAMIKDSDIVAVCPPSSLKLMNRSSGLSTNYCFLRYTTLSLAYRLHSKLSLAGQKVQGTYKYPHPRCSRLERKILRDHGWRETINS